jgi:ATP-binding cassette subfamily B protein
VVIGKAVNRIYAAARRCGHLMRCCAGLYLGDWLVRFLQQYLMASIGQSMILHIRKSVCLRHASPAAGFFDRSQHGELMSRLTNDVDNISTTISDSLSQLMTYCFTVLGIFVVMLSKSPPLTLVALASRGAGVSADRGDHPAYAQALRKAAGKTWASSTARWRKASPASVVKAFGREAI